MCRIYGSNYSQQRNDALFAVKITILFICDNVNCHFHHIAEIVENARTDVNLMSLVVQIATLQTHLATDVLRSSL